MIRMKATTVRREFSDMLNRVSYKGERIIMERHGKDVACIIPLEDLKLLDKFEEHLDIEAAKRALKEEGTVSWDKIKNDLGL